ncbi:MAG: NUDIX domain-containing protein [Candidatus Nanoarchaeia archaeon]
MRNVSRVLIQKKEKILFIHRHKKGIEFFTLPGGGIEEGETPEEAAVREAKEETSLSIKIDELLWKLQARSKGELGELFVFSAKDVEGVTKLGGPEEKRNRGENKYELEWISISKINNLFILPPELGTVMKERFGAPEKT